MIRATSAAFSSFIQSTHSSGKRCNERKRKWQKIRSSSVSGERKMIDDKKAPESFKTYEDGKHRRYQLLFTVNGGAFAVAKLFADKDASRVLGGLTLRQLSIGMVLFTVVMTVDIYMFGEKMRKKYLPEDFNWQGKTVLILIGIIICGGWLLVGQ